MVRQALPLLDESAQTQGTLARLSERTMDGCLADHAGQLIMITSLGRKVRLPVQCSAFVHDTLFRYRRLQGRAHRRRSLLRVHWRRAAPRRRWADSN